MTPTHRTSVGHVAPVALPWSLPDRHHTLSMTFVTGINDWRLFSAQKRIALQAQGGRRTSVSAEATGDAETT